MIENLTLFLRQSGLQLFACLAQFSAFLLRLPILTENLTDLVLIELELCLKLVHPDDLLRDFWDITSYVQCLVHFLLIQELFLQDLDVFMHLVQELGLVLGDGTFDLRSHQELVIVIEYLEHLVGGDGLGELLL